MQISFGKLAIPALFVLGHAAAFAPSASALPCTRAGCPGDDFPSQAQPFSLSADVAEALAPKLPLVKTMPTRVGSIAIHTVFVRVGDGVTKVTCDVTSTYSAGISSSFSACSVSTNAVVDDEQEPIDVNAFLKLLQTPPAE